MSTSARNLDRRRDALTKAGAGHLFADTITGTARLRPELDRLLDQLRPADVVVVTKYDRLARSLKELLEIVEAIESKCAGFRSLAEDIDTTTPAGRLVFHVFAFPDPLPYPDRTQERDMTKPVRPNPESRPAFLGDLFETLTDRGRALLRRRGPPQAVPPQDLATFGDSLLSRRGEASGVALAQALLSAFEAASPDERLTFLQTLADRFGPDRQAVDTALDAVRRASTITVVSGR